MSSSRDWGITQDSTLAGAYPTGAHKVPYTCTGQPTSQLPQGNTLDGKLPASKSSMLLPRSLYSADVYAVGNSRPETEHLNPLRNLHTHSSYRSKYSGSSSSFLNIDSHGHIPDVQHPDSLDLQRLKLRDQDAMLSHKSSCPQCWSGYCSRSTLSEQKSSYTRPTPAVLDLTALATSTPSELEEFLRPSYPSILLPSQNQEFRATRHAPYPRQPAPMKNSIAANSLGSQHSELAPDDVPCRDQTIKPTLVRTGCSALNDVKYNSSAAKPSWTIGTSVQPWLPSSYRPSGMHASTRKLTLEDVPSTFAPLNWLLNDDTHSTSSSSSASSQSSSNSSYAASSWLSDCPSMCGVSHVRHSDDDPVLEMPQKPASGTATVGLLLPSEQRRAYTTDRSDVWASNISSCRTSSSTGSQISQRYLARPWLHNPDLEAKSMRGLHIQPPQATVPSHQAGMPSYAAHKPGHSSSWQSVSEKQGSVRSSSEDSQSTYLSGSKCSTRTCSPTIVKRPSEYQDLSCPFALELANELLACIKLPGNFKYVPVSKDSPLYMLGVVYQFTAFDVALGSTYYQRLRHGFSNSSFLMDMMLGSPAVTGQSRLIPVRRYLRQEQLSQLARKQAFLSVLQYVSLLLAAKVLGSRTDLSSETLRLHISRAYQMHVQLEKAVDVEVLCLRKLQWRLGPFVEDDQLQWLASLEWL